MSGARDAALKALERCRRDGAWSDSVLAVLAEKAGLDARDSALAGRLCQGVLQNTLLLDFYIGQYSKTPVKRLEPKVLDILRLSAYQLLFMDKIPPQAAVSEGVALCRRAGLERASGLVNAVLRRVAENRGKLPEIPGEGTAEYLSVKYSHPLWLAEAFAARLGYAGAEALMWENNGIPRTALQVNGLKTTAEALLERFARAGVEAAPHPWLENCIELASAGRIAGLPGFDEGLFYVQDPAARLVVTAGAPEPGQTALDACAAPGGKSFALALAMGNRGRVLACDIHKNKLSRVISGAARLGINIIETRVMDAKMPSAEFAGRFDLVLADVPCSGLGVIRKKPDIRYKDPAALSGLPEVQLDILRGLAPCVKPGGVLVYSTCTLLERENEGVVGRFLTENENFGPDGFDLPEGARAESVKPGMATLWPHMSGTDGFFICRLRRTK